MEKYGLDKPLHVQFVSQLKNMLRGDFGNSIIYNRSVADMIKERLPATLLLGLVDCILALIIGTALGIFCARRDGSFIDNFLSSIAYTLEPMPSFWLGLMLIIVFSSRLNLLPAQGMENVREGYEGFRHTLDVMEHMVLP